jgi:hypothetical protein
LKKIKRTNRLQLSWLNAILHLTATIANKKRFLFSSNVLHTFQGVLSVIVLEGVLSIMSFPLYFIKMDEVFSEKNIFNIQFRVRKILTLGLVVAIVLSFVVKVALVFYVSFFAIGDNVFCGVVFPVLDGIMMYGSLSIMGIGFLMLFLTT